MLEVIDLEPTNIIPFALMDIEQSSTKGNLHGISRMLIDELKILKNDFIQGIFLVGGDQLLAERVHSIQKQREGDIPGEDFSGVLPVLGAFHTNMNFKKMMMKMFLGDKSRKVLGSLQNLNKKLRRKYIDEKAGNYWACEGGAKTWDKFHGKSKMGEIRWRQVVAAVSNKLRYKHVSNLRDEEEDSRDHVYENLLLFMRIELEFRCFYKAIREADVGIIELVLQLWAPQFLGGGGTKYRPELVELRCRILYE
ncbi:hypothetical protein BGX38DRAFT_1279448 [Terfezia claveryi]|nr:hypothetical protein BGX38DRAFT_1279448 [Terfezia claveryi]